MITIIGSIVIYILAPFAINVFSNEPEIQQTAVTYLRLILFIYPLIAIAMTSGRVMQGLGLGVLMLVTSIIRVLGVSVPLALFFNYILQKPIEWMWYAMMTSTVVAVFTAILDESSWIPFIPGESHQYLLSLLID